MVENQTYTAAWRVQGDGRTAGHMPVIGGKKDAGAAHFSALVSEAAGAEGAAGAAKPAHSFGFLDFIKTIIDIINPLQHIPVISTIYRHITGDEINPVARVAGGALFGGPIGAAASAADVAIEGATGRDIGENVLALIAPGKDEKGGEQVQMAQAQTRYEDIVWDDAPAENARAALLAPQKNEIPGIPSSPGPAPTKPSYRMGLTGSATGFSGPSSQAKRGDAGSAAETAMRGKVNVKPALLQHGAPAGSPENGPVPPELIATRMMEGLDKYAALKGPQMNPGSSAVF